MTGMKRKNETIAEAAFSLSMGDILLQQNDLEDLRTQIQALNTWHLNILECQELLDSTDGKRVLRTARTINWRYSKYRTQASSIERVISKNRDIVQKGLREMVAAASLPADHEVYKETGSQASDPVKTKIATAYEHKTEDNTKCSAEHKTEDKSEEIKRSSKKEDNPEKQMDIQPSEEKPSEMTA
jgi:hypothetical protein